MSTSVDGRTKEYLLVAAIDFGTTYSSWAFSFTNDQKKFYTKQWIGGANVSLKAPTTVLIKPDGKTLEAFGYEAEDKYGEMLSENGSTDHYYFKQFKMKLFDQNGLKRNIQLEDARGKLLPAKTVFSLAISYLRKDLLKNSCKQGLTEDVRETDIHWVLTVPAIWNDAAKQFMRESAVEGGIANDQLTIAIEPEAASLFCRHILEGDGLEEIKSGAKYLVFDAGGGTVDISVHQVIKGGKLREFHKASGGAWGGTQVDKAFTQLLTDLVGEPVMEPFQKEHTKDEIDIMRAFEVKKRNIEPTNDGTTLMLLPTTLTDLFKARIVVDLNAIARTIFAGQITVSGDRMTIDGSLMKTLFTETIDKMVSHLKTIMSDPSVSGTEFIVMVGGFSESLMVQEAIRANFPQMRLVIPPEDAGLAVLKGAVTFGHCPSSVVERVCRYTYGIERDTIFVKGEDDADKKFTVSDGTIYCREVFDKHVELGEIIEYGVPQTRKVYYPTTKEQTKIPFSLYASTNRNPKYVTDVGVRKVSYMSIPITDRSVPKDERGFEAHITFSGTEIEVTAKEVRTGKVHSVLVDFLKV